MSLSFCKHFLLISLFSSVAFARFEPNEGHYTPVSGDTGYIRNVQVVIVNRIYQVFGKLCYSNNPSYCHPFTIYLTRPGVNEYHLSGSGTMTATFIHPTYGDYDCPASIGATVFSYPGTNRILLKVWAPTTYPNQVPGRTCPSPNNYSWATAVFQSL